MTMLSRFFKIVPQTNQYFFYSWDFNILRGAFCTFYDVASFEVFVILNTFSCFTIVSLRNLIYSENGHARRTVNWYTEVRYTKKKILKNQNFPASQAYHQVVDLGLLS